MGIHIHHTELTCKQIILPYSGSLKQKLSCQSVCNSMHICSPRVGAPKCGLKYRSDPTRPRNDAQDDGIGLIYRSDPTTPRNGAQDDGIGPNGLQEPPLLLIRPCNSSIKNSATKAFLSFSSCPLT